MVGDNIRTWRVRYFVLARCALIYKNNNTRKKNNYLSLKKMMYKHVPRVMFMKKLFIKFLKNYELNIKAKKSWFCVIFLRKREKKRIARVIQRATKIERGKLKESYRRKYFSQLAQLLRRGKSSINRKIVAQRWKWLEVNVSNPFTPLAQLKKAL